MISRGGGFYTSNHTPGMDISIKGKAETNRKDYKKQSALTPLSKKGE